MQEIVIATHNQGKMREFKALFAGLPIKWISLADLDIHTDVEETGDSFVANARLKAESYAKLTQRWTLADDSGLAVDALDGRPGIYSARYPQPGATQAEQHAALLAELAAVPDAARGAQFVCVLALATPMGTHLTEGFCEGRIAHAPAGTDGFGYDPLFYVPSDGVTMAELPAARKNEISHRAVAVGNIRLLLSKILKLD